MRDLIDAGIHFGHKSSRWNPKMKPYIFCSRNSIHIIDVKETIKGLLRSKKLLSHVVANGQDVLFVGTKRQARKPIQEQTERCGMHYVSERWLGGTLTNFRTIRSRLGRMEELEAMEQDGTMAAHSKKMQAMLRREMHKIKRNLEGVRNMNKLPGCLVIIDARRENIAIHEAAKLGIPTICLLDTDSDPGVVDVAIPGNDDAMKAIELVLAQMADAINEGKKGRAIQQALDEQSGEPQRRSRRVSTSQAADISKTAAAPAPAPVDAAPAPAAPAAEAPATPVAEKQTETN